MDSVGATCSASCSTSTLEREELVVQELMEILGMAQSRVSRHLAILREVGLLSDRRDGTYVFYRFVPPAEGAWRDGWALVSYIEALARYYSYKLNLQMIMAMVNRAWDRLIGRPIVEPVDDFNDLNIALARKLYSRAMKHHTLEMRKHGSIRELIRGIVLSEDYGRKLEPPRTRIADTLGPRNYVHPWSKKTLDYFTLPEEWKILATGGQTNVRVMVPAKEGLSAEFRAKYKNKWTFGDSREYWARRMIDRRKVIKVVLEDASHVEYVEIEGDFPCDMRMDGISREFKVLHAKISQKNGEAWKLMLIGPRATVTERREEFLKIVRSMGQ